ncbi:hypothetical protein [Rhodoferax antarcticus]|uniref:hypothetical protein n=1 Tax=Rhodoferax antarcticus TaxID=81479 RepID=UPI0022252E21|nr:hypothetical protein [Rhodoferax antarcticus]MCW2311433.1 hypothetical protein [Rhodoferax antarcticus]
MHNVYEQFKQLLSTPQLQVGTVSEHGTGVVTVELPGGGTVKARGSANLGARVFVRDGVLEAVAPNLSLEIIEI